MTRLSVLERVSRPGADNRANEDALGSNICAAFVFDGATGLGERQIMAEHGSDAAWLAAFAAEYFETRLSLEQNVQPAVSSLINEARTIFDSASSGEKVERFAWPSASFVALKTDEDGVTVSGLGDCTIYASIKDKVELFSPLAGFSSFENDRASHHIKQAGGFGTGKDLLSNPETLAELRSVRALQNTTQSGVWTLGLEPEAADHLATKRFSISATSHCLLCSDGFSALVDTYGAYTPETLLETALTSGLEELFSELRHIEHSIDPDGKRFPRFKRSDDATAMLVRIEI